VTFDLAEFRPHCPAQGDATNIVDRERQSGTRRRQTVGVGRLQREPG
jgi:hypothetical protein